jgi:hypothetical protein
MTLWLASRLSDSFAAALWVTLLHLFVILRLKCVRMYIQTEALIWNPVCVNTRCPDRTPFPGSCDSFHIETEWDLRVRGRREACLDWMCEFLVSIGLGFHFRAGCSLGYEIKKKEAFSRTFRWREFKLWLWMSRGWTCRTQIGLNNKTRRGRGELLF